jgi:hypothetical protein
MVGMSLLLIIAALGCLVVLVTGLVGIQALVYRYFYPHHAYQACERTPGLCLLCRYRATNWRHRGE